MEWKNKYFKPSSYREEDKRFLTNNNELVRSKSEKILADLISNYNIIYKYECPLFLDKYDQIFQTLPLFVLIQSVRFTGNISIWWIIQNMQLEP